MKKKMRFFRFLALATLVALGMVGCKTEMTRSDQNRLVPPGGRVDLALPELTGGAEIFVYVPGGINSLSLLTEPILLIYGSSDFTQSSVKQMAEESGLAALARRENCVIAFVNSIGATWGQADADAYKVYAGRLFAERTNQTVPADQTWYAAHNRYGNGQYSGYAGNRVYAIAEGSGADFVSGYLVDDNIDTVYGWGATAGIRAAAAPVGVMLFNPATPPIKGGTNNFKYLSIVVNGSASVNNAYGRLNNVSDRVVTLSSGVTSGFDYDILAAQFDKLISVRKTNLSNTNMAFFDVPIWSELGIEVFDKTIPVSGTDRRYLTYVPNSIKNAANGTVPVVMLFHGGGETADYIALLTTWPEVGAKEGFIVVSVDQHTTMTDVVQHTTIIDQVLTDYPQIDRTRVYASGFSMGSIKSLRLGVGIPGYLAAIASFECMPGVTPGAGDDNSLPALVLDRKIPTFYVGGHLDTYPGIFPKTGASGAANAIATIDRLFTMNDIGVGSYTYSGTASNDWWGIDNFSSVETVQVTHGVPMTIRINSLVSNDGNVYTKLVDISDMAHSVSPDIIPYAWDFMKQFRRNANGAITILP